jgi:hypothetical protein
VITIIYFYEVKVRITGNQIAPDFLAVIAATLYQSLPVFTGNQINPDSPGHLKRGFLTIQYIPSSRIRRSMTKTNYVAGYRVSPIPKEIARNNGQVTGIWWICAKYLKEKYSGPVYGTNMKSLNFEGHQWVSTTGDGSVVNPYYILPKIHEGFDNELFDEMIIDEEAGIYDGGAAMLAYAKMQFTQMTGIERERIAKSLLRYCELDTLAMVMIWEGWLQSCKTE